MSFPWKLSLPNHVCSTVILVPRAAILLASASDRELWQHSGQMSAHVRVLSTSGLFPEHTTERTVREFVSEILLGIFFRWMNHYLNDLPRMIPRMTEDLCGSKRKKGDPV